MSTNDITKIKIENITNVKYETISEFKNSISYEAYKRGLDITKEIISSNENYYTSLMSKEASGTELRNAEQIYNIIFFTGNRGTGKTSVMLSFMEFLKDYYRNCKRDNLNNLPEMKLRKDDYMFTGLEYIDGSSLDSKEDILGSVLAKMLKKWNAEENRSYGNNGIIREENYNYRKRQIYKQFNEVYKYLKNLRSNTDIMDEDSDMFIETLENMSMTWNLKNAFQQLVENYLQIMEYPESGRIAGNSKHFLVVSIDDLDLDIDKGFQLLDQVRNYLMIPNIIVLMSANYEQMEKVCINYYTKKFKEIKDNDGIRDYIVKMSREYLEKMLPVQRQVILHSGEKWKYFNKKSLELTYISSDNKKVCLQGSVKEIIKNDLKKYLGISCATGDKMLNYLAPDTLRELISWVIQVNSLQEIDELNIGVEDAEYSTNVEWMLYEQFSEVVTKYLTQNEQDIFKMLDTLETQAQIRFLKENFPGNSKISLAKKLCDLNQGKIEEQKLASICNLYFSIKLTEILESLSWQNEDDKKKKLDTFMEYYDNGLWGNWERNMISPFIESGASKASFYRIGYTNFKKDNACLKLELIGEYNSNKWEDTCRFVIDNRDKLINYQYILLFYNINKDYDILQKSLWTCKKEGSSVILNRECTGFFALSNIVLNILDGAKLVSKFNEELITLLYTGDLVSTERIKKDWLRYVSILDSKNDLGITKWVGEAILPLGNFEYVINLGKEIEYNLKETAVEKLSCETVIPVINSFFEIINFSLQENYKDYLVQFTDCPPIKKILDKDKSFMEMLYYSIRCHISPYEKDEDDWS